MQADAIFSKKTGSGSDFKITTSNCLIFHFISSFIPLTLNSEKKKKKESGNIYVDVS